MLAYGVPLNNVLFLIKIQNVRPNININTKKRKYEIKDEGAGYIDQSETSSSELGLPIKRQRILSQHKHDQSYIQYNFENSLESKDLSDISRRFLMQSNNHTNDGENECSISDKQHSPGSNNNNNSDSATNITGATNMLASEDCSNFVSQLSENTAMFSPNSSMLTTLGNVLPPVPIAVPLGNSTQRPNNNGNNANDLSSLHSINGINAMNAMNGAQPVGMGPIAATPLANTQFGQSSDDLSSLSFNPGFETPDQSYDTLFMDQMQSVANNVNGVSGSSSGLSTNLGNQQYCNIGNNCNVNFASESANGNQMNDNGCTQMDNNHNGVRHVQNINGAHNIVLGQNNQNNIGFNNININIHNNGNSNSNSMQHANTMAGHSTVAQYHTNMSKDNNMHVHTILQPNGKLSKISKRNNKKSSKSRRKRRKKSSSSSNTGSSNDTDTRSMRYDQDDDSDECANINDPHKRWYKSPFQTTYIDPKEEQTLRKNSTAYQQFIQSRSMIFQQYRNNIEQLNHIGAMSSHSKTRRMKQYQIEAKIQEKRVFLNFIRASQQPHAWLIGHNGPMSVSIFPSQSTFNNTQNHNHNNSHNQNHNVLGQVNVANNPGAINQGQPNGNINDGTLTINTNVNQSLHISADSNSNNINGNSNNLNQPNVNNSTNNPKTNANMSAITMTGRRVKKPKFSEYDVRVLRDWYEMNLDNPYPTSQEKEVMCELTGLSKYQVSRWFCNARTRRPKETSETTHASSTEANNNVLTDQNGNCNNNNSTNDATDNAANQSVTNTNLNNCENDNSNTNNRHCKTSQSNTSNSSQKISKRSTKSKSKKKSHVDKNRRSIYENSFNTLSSRLNSNVIPSFFQHIRSMQYPISPALNPTQTHPSSVHNSNIHTPNNPNNHSSVPQPIYSPIAIASMSPMFATPNNTQRHGITSLNIHPMSVPRSVQEQYHAAQQAAAIAASQQTQYHPLYNHHQLQQTAPPIIAPVSQFFPTTFTSVATTPVNVNVNVAQSHSQPDCTPMNANSINNINNMTNIHNTGNMNNSNNQTVMNDINMVSGSASSGTINQVTSSNSCTNNRDNSLNDNDISLSSVPMLSPVHQFAINSNLNSHNHNHSHVNQSMISAQHS